MAVFNDYIVTGISDREGRPVSPLEGQGTRVKAGRIVFDTVAAWDALSIVRFLHAIPSTAVIKRLEVYTDGVTGASDVNFGLYDVLRNDGTGGDEVGTELLASALDLSSGITRKNALDATTNITLANCNKMLWEVAGQSIDSRNTHFDIGMQFIADPSEADTVVVDYELFFP